MASGTELTFKLTGADTLVDRLSKFTSKLQVAAGRKSARRAMNIVRKAAIANVRKHDDPETAARIWRNIYVQQSRRQSQRVGGVVMRVGVLGGARQYANTAANRRSGKAGSSYKTLGDKGNPGGDTWYWRFLELGTERQPARPFLRPALENNVQGVTTTLITELTREIDQIAAGK